MLKREHKVSNISSEAIFAIPAMKPSRVIFASIFCLFLMITDIRYESGSSIRSLGHDVLMPISHIAQLPIYISQSFKVLLMIELSVQVELASKKEL
jgi:hypothetical protein